MTEVPGGHADPAERPPDPAEAAAPGAAAIVRFAQLTRDRWRDERQLAHAINGTVVGASVIAVVSAHGTLGQTALSVLLTLVVYWISERYAHLLAAGVRSPDGRLEPAAMWAVLRRGWPLVEASYLPLLVLVVVGLLTSVQIGALAALGTSTLLLVALGYLAARRGGAAVTTSIGWAAGSGLLGLLAVGLKYLLH